MREFRSHGSVRGALSNECPLYVAACSAGDVSPSKPKSGEPHASLRSRTCAVDLAPLLRAPLFMSNGIQGRGMPLIPCTRWPDTEPCRVRRL